MSTLLPISEPREASPMTGGGALWQLGFRPFYLLASAFAALSIAVWAAQFTGWIGSATLSGPVWHAHEMLFGFALAVVVGFLFTAGRNWSNRPTPTGKPLMALAALWLAGRILVLTPWSWAAAIVDSAFPLAAAAALAVPFWAARLKRNYFFVALLVLLAAVNFAIHLAQMGVVALPAFAGIQVGLDALLFIMAVMTGRVVPMFTNNGVPGAGASRNATVEKVALGTVLLLLALDLAGVRGAVLAALLVVCAVTHAARLLLWRPWRTLGTPLVWVLHLAYAWIPLHLAFRAAAEAGWIATSVATHALTVGAVGGLIIGMMTRTSRGHTARPLRADRVEVACYVLVLAAAVVRVFVPLAFPALTVAAAVAAAVLWSSGFGLFAIRYWPILTRPRLDGRPG